MSFADQIVAARRNVSNAGNDLRTTRETVGLSLRQLADALGAPFDPPMLSRIERGQIMPPVDVAERLDRWLAGQVRDGVRHSSTVDDPHARRSDPASSHVAVAAIARNVTLREFIDRYVDTIAEQNLRIRGRAATGAEVTFDDGDLLDAYERVTGRRGQRNVIAKARKLYEASTGRIERVGVLARPDRPVDTLHFRVAS